MFLSLMFVASTLVADAEISAEPDWSTPAELSAFTRTPRLDETMAWFRRLEQASDKVQVSSFGVSPEGRELPLVVISSHGAFTPEAARELGKEILLIQACIHPGENEGKDALMAVARELTVKAEDSALLEHVTLVIIPIFNVDGHERFSPYNRINQNGPEAMGWRATAQNLNLNRDFMKADSPEMQAWLGLWNAWQPDMLVDMHNTNGADYQYELTWAWEYGPNIHPALGEWQQRFFAERVQGEMEEKGWKLHRYVSLVDRYDLKKGLRDWVSTPRFSCGYAAVAQRACLLVETLMLKDFRTRTRVNEDLLMSMLRQLAAEPGSLRKAVSSAEASASARSASAGARYPLSFTTADVSREVEFLGYRYTSEHSEISAGPWVQYDQGQPHTFRLPMYDRIEVHAEIDVPLAYLVPAAWTDVIHRLDLHGIRSERIEQAITVRAQSIEFSAVEFAQRPFEGRHGVTRFHSETSIREVTLAPGSLRVPLDQPRADIAMHLLEPESPDSLLRWGFFNAIFEDKEYAEPRVMEAMARRMLAEDPDLQAKFEQRLQDPDFASSPAARLRFFYQLTPYFDQALNRYPVLRELRVPPAAASGP